MNLNQPVKQSPPPVCFQNPGAERLYFRLLETIRLVLEDSSQRVGVPLKHPASGGFDPKAGLSVDGGEAFLRFATSRFELQCGGASHFFDLGDCRNILRVIDEVCGLLDDPISGVTGQDRVSVALEELRNRVLDVYADLNPARVTAAIC